MVRKKKDKLVQIPPLFGMFFLAVANEKDKTDRELIVGRIPAVREAFDLVLGLQWGQEFKVGRIWIEDVSDTPIVRGEILCKTRYIENQRLEYIKWWRTSSLWSSPLWNGMTKIWKQDCLYWTEMGCSFCDETTLHKLRRGGGAILLADFEKHTRTVEDEILVGAVVLCI